ncbi:MAG: hypothetical protein WDW36_008464 [Sanguina aurantia]
MGTDSAKPPWTALDAPAPGSGPCDAENGDAEDERQWRSVTAPRNTGWRALYGAVVTLSLGVLGSTILPVPYAFSKVGVSVGCLTMAVVAAANDATCSMMIRAAAFTGLDTYEALAEWAGGPNFKKVTQASLILLLFGTLCGGLAFLSDVGRILVQKGIPEAPELFKQDGRPLMLLVVLLVLLPLCLQRHIRQLESAATFGILVVLALCGIITAKAFRTGFPAIQNGELPLLSLRVDENLPEAFAVLGFAFYMQPMVMPLLKEMPLGSLGVSITERAVQICLYGVACLVYGSMGVFGASIYGQSTEGNIMVNDILDDYRAVLALYFLLLLYLCCGMVTTHFALRSSIDILLFGGGAPRLLLPTGARGVHGFGGIAGLRLQQHAWSSASRAGVHDPGASFEARAAETVGALGCSLVVALLFPTQAEKMFAVTGATGVCLVCYVIPSCIHRKVVLVTAQRQQQLRDQQDQQQGPLGSPGLASAQDAHRSGSGGRGGGGGARGVAALQPLLSEEDRGVVEVLLGDDSQGGGSEWGCGEGKRGVNGGGVRTWVGYARHCLVDMVQPAFIVGLGVSFSVAGLYVAIRDWGAT